MRIAVFNIGSSSVKSSLFDLVHDRARSRPLVESWASKLSWNLREQSATDAIERAVSQMPGGPIAVAGHRIAHGGAALTSPVLIDAGVKEEIARLGAFAPEHNPAQLEGIEAAQELLGPETNHVAVFDTAFHSTIPVVAALYPVPYEWSQQGIRRYGFHGISHCYAAHRGAGLAGSPLESLRVVTCHLGNGASLCAVRDGRSVDTTMGFTPLEGLMMGSRSGSLDPGILIDRARAGWSAEELDDVLNRQSGLKGVSGISSDMREIRRQIENGHERARLAFELYIYRLCRELGGMVAAAGGLDLLVFTGGVGEHSPDVREGVCERFSFLGLEIDLDRNRDIREDAILSTSSSRVGVAVVRAREDIEIARQCWQALKAQDPTSRRTRDIMASKVGTCPRKP